MWGLLGLLICWVVVFSIFVVTQRPKSQEPTKTRIKWFMTRGLLALVLSWVIIAVLVDLGWWPGSFKLGAVV